MNVYEISFDYFKSIKSEWNNLVLADREATIFDSWEWLYSFWKIYGKEYFKPFIILVEKAGQIIGAAAFRLDKLRLKFLDVNILNFLAQGIVSDYNNILSLKECKVSIVENIVNYIKNKEFWDVAVLSDIPDSVLVNKKLIDDLGLKVQSSKSQVYYINLPKNWDSYYYSLGKKLKKNIRRCRNLLNRKGKLEYYFTNTPTVSEFRTFAKLHQMRMHSLGRPGVFADSQVYKFHEQLINLKTKWVNLQFLLFNGEPIAGIYGFIFKKRFYCYLAGLDPKYSRYSVGTFLLSESIKYCINNNLEEYDFLRGVEKYKYRWTKAYRTNHRYIILRKDWKLLYTLFKIGCLKIPNIFK